MQRFAHKETCRFMRNNQELETLWMTNSGIVEPTKKGCMFVEVHLYEGAHACKDQNTALCIFPQEPPTLFLRQDIWLDQRLSIRLGWPANLRSCLFPPSPWHWGCTCMSSHPLPMWVLSSKFSSWSHVRIFQTSYFHLPDEQAIWQQWTKLKINMLAERQKYMSYVHVNMPVI